jgi:cleavage and polyadenylation specificity factor subunit 3
MLHAPQLSRKRPVTAVGAGPAAGAAPGARGNELVEGAPSDRMTIMPLGGGQEVGRSCIVVQYRGATVMLDCGLHTQRKGLDALPFLDIGVDLDTVDLVRA